MKPEKWAATADALLRGSAGALLLCLLGSVTLGVVSRQLNAPLSWTDEMASYLLVWTGFAGWMIALRRHSHIRIGMIADRLSGTPRLVLEIATQAAVALMGALILRHSFGLIERNWDVESIALPFPSAALYLPMPVLGLALILQALADGASALRGHVAHAEEKPL